VATGHSSPENKTAPELGWSTTSLRRADAVTFPDERSAALQQPAPILTIPLRGKM
jgi:hypothetical protein